MAQSWPWDNQIAVKEKNKKLKRWPFNCKVNFENIVLFSLEKDNFWHIFQKVSLFCQLPLFTIQWQPFDFLATFGKNTFCLTACFELNKYQWSNFFVLLTLLKITENYQIQITESLLYEKKLVEMLFRHFLYFHL